MKGIRENLRKEINRPKKSESEVRFLDMGFDSIVMLNNPKR